MCSRVDNVHTKFRNIKDGDYIRSNLPIKLRNCWWDSGCFQLCGQLTITVLCFKPPSPPTWIKCDVPSLKLEDMTTWGKPFTFSVSISFRKDLNVAKNQRQLLDIITNGVVT